ncbi:MAG: cation-transporting P-type ATPase [Gammaproteobacteria bacterium]|nr:cation-transporting P-type ATPase [Gammaproteobacteria bacterium]
MIERVNSPNSKPAWHAVDIQQVMERLSTHPEGLSENEGQRRLETHGANRIPPPKRRSALVRLLAQFNNVLIYVLIVAALVTILLEHLVDAGVIIGVVLINGLIGFIQEGKAEKAIDAVRNMLSAQATVIRSGRRYQLPAEGLVPGDVVFVQSGDRVPADLRLFRLKELRIEEAILTGESVPVVKQIESVREAVPLGDRRCLAFSGTFVTYGQGFGVVVETGPQTEIGRISAMLAQVHKLTTPLMRQLASFARWLTGAILIIAIATMVFGALARDYALGEMFLAAVGLAVAAIPEGLPAVITIALAIGVQRMARRNAIIRRLPAVETLGSVSVICSDKTGTLTRNEMTVQRMITADGMVEVSGVGYDPHGGFSVEGQDLPSDSRPEIMELCRTGLLCNDATLMEEDGVWRIQGDPTEGALVVLGVKAGLEPMSLLQGLPRDDLIPFESQHRFMATLHHDHTGQGFIYLKGAYEAIVPRCLWQRSGVTNAPLDRDRWLARQEAIAALGQRTLALAVKPADADQRSLRFEDVETGLVLLGLIGIIDPPREEAISAVAHCRAAGIQVKMITGDHAGTATAIAAQMGLAEHSLALTGLDLENLDDAALRQVVEEVDVFARASPEHKLRLVEALQARGRVVAMTGDGVNDAPALKRANVGVAMGIKGTEAAKEAAEMVLADDNFASIAHAVEEGRTVFDNIKKSILFILPTNGGEALTILAAITLGKMLPVTAPQILWVNMITAVTLALSLVFEPAESDVMHRKPRDINAPMLSGFMTWRILFVSLLMVLGTFGLFLWERLHGAEIEVARTVAVNTLVVAEIFYLFNTRYLSASALSRNGLLGNRYVLYAAGTVIVFQLLFTYLPLMQHFFHTAPIGVEAWLRILGVGMLLFLAVELEKAWFRRRL